jgi:DNA helicase HerA-like ATPase
MGEQGSAWSSAGSSFRISAPRSVPLQPGGLVRLSSAQGAEYVGQLLELDDLPSGGRGGDERRVIGTGALLGRRAGDDVLPIGSELLPDEVTVEPAPPELVRAWQRAVSGSRTALPLGSMQLSASDVASLVAAGFNRHTFLCGQSGSGKTYALGVVLEQLLLNTRIRIVVLDPNSDYVNLDQLADQPAADGEPVGPVAVFRSSGDTRLRVRFGRLPFRQQALVVALDPIADVEEYALMHHVAEVMGTREYSLLDIRLALDGLTGRGGRDAETAYQLALRIDNLGVAGWSIWAAADQPPLLDQLPEHWRAAVLDLGDLAYPEERSAVVASVLTGLWAQRAAREPLLLVMDEAHNVCPREPSDAHQALAIEHATRIAAEGRKYGIYLLLATQSPGKLHPNVLAQCENLILMKMNSSSDVQRVAEVFSHVPSGLISLATSFSLGEGLAAGRISPTPQLFRSGARLSPEGGADVPTTWADPA